MAILLKTASVQVSSIQIMQVRVQNKGKSVWKSRYDGYVSRALADVRKFGCLRLRITLQGLVLLDGVLELLLDHADPGLVLLACGALLGRFVLGLGQRLLEGRHLGCVP